MISLNTSIADIILQRTLNDATYGLNDAINRMTTGYKLLHAKDNAAGYSIAKDLEVKISSMLQVQQNALDGADLVATAEGGLDQILGKLSRLRAIAVDASNGTYGELSREAMQLEADSILDTIEQIKSSTNYNGKNLFQSVAWVDSNSPEVEKPSGKPYIPNSSEGSIKPVKPPTNITVDDTSGLLDFDAGETKIITIDGVKYTVTNDASTQSSFSYDKDTTNGQIKFTCSNYTIKGQVNVKHHILVDGMNNAVYGGNLDDVLASVKQVSTIQLYNYFYGGKGDDTITLENRGEFGIGEDGDDIIISNEAGAQIYAGNGNDTITLNYCSDVSVGGGLVSAGDGDDTINVYRKLATIYGEKGNDTFNLNANAQEVKIIGGDGTNTTTGTLPSSYTIVNSTHANANGTSLAGGETKTVTIDGKEYTLTNNLSSSALNVFYTVSNGKISFSYNSYSSQLPSKSTTSSSVEDYNPTEINVDGNLTIRGELEKSHNVILLSSQTTFYGGNLNDVIETSDYSVYYVNVYGLGGDDTITLNGDHSYINGGAGNDIITSNRYGIVIEGGTGDDKITANNAVIIDNSGTNTISGLNTASPSSVSGTNCDASVVQFASGETKTLNINGKNYNITNGHSDVNSLTYKISGDTILFGGSGFLIDGEAYKEHDVQMWGSRNIFKGGELNDKIVSKGTTQTFLGLGGDDIIYADTYNCDYIYGGDGNDTITCKTNWSTVSGGRGNDTINIYANNSYNGNSGNDTYNIYSNATVTDLYGDNTYNVKANNTTINAGNGKDKFYIDSANNKINGGGGDDYFVVNSTGVNTVDGSTGYNTCIDNSSGNATLLNMGTGSNANIGSLRFYSQGEVQTCTINGVEYTIVNQNADDTSPANNQLNYSYNPDTQELRFDGSNFTITASSSANLLINGNNNTVNGSDKDDKITVEAGSNNIVNGGKGNDTLWSQSANNSINGDDGDDTIVIDAGSNKAITGGNGNDTVILNSGNNTDVNLGEGDNNLKCNSNNNNIVLGNGDNTINVNGSLNSIQSGDGVDKITVSGDKNTIKSGGGDDYFTVKSGENNNLDGEDGFNKLTDKGIDTITANLYVQSASPFELYLKIDTGYDDNSVLRATLDLSIPNLEIDLSTAETSLKAIDVIDEIMRNLEAQAVNLGSLTNRLMSIIDAQGVKMESLVSSRSTIKDADIAKESSNFIRYQILQQASATLMNSTRNLRAENVLGLLRGLNG